MDIGSNEQRIVPWVEWSRSSKQVTGGIGGSTTPTQRFGDGGARPHSGGDRGPIDGKTIFRGSGIRTGSYRFAANTRILRKIPHDRGSSVVCAAIGNWCNHGGTISVKQHGWRKR